MSPMSCNLFLVIAQLIIVKNDALIWRESRVDEPLLLAKWGAFIGGQEAPSEMIEFNTEDSSFTEHSNSFSFGYQQSQSSTQNGDLLYMLPSSSTNINVFNLSAGARIPSLTIYGDGHLREGDQLNYRCLVYYQQHLMILGGLVAYNYNGYGTKFTIYDIENGTWSTGTSLPTGTGRASCNVVNGVLYLIGGGIMDSGTHSFSTSDVWTIDVSQVPDVNGAWSLMTANLTQSREGHRSVVLSGSDLIYVVGGEYDDSLSIGEEAVSSVDIIDTAGVNDSIYFDSDLIRGQRDVALIEVDNVWYVFGGFPTSTQGVMNDYYQHSVNVIPTTAAPSGAPTIDTSAIAPIYPNSFILFIVCCFAFKLIKV